MQGVSSRTEFVDRLCNARGIWGGILPPLAITPWSPPQSPHRSDKRLLRMRVNVQGKPVGVTSKVVIRK